MRGSGQRVWRLCRDRSGAGALEFALVAPVLIVLIVGVIQVSLALYKGATVQWVAERAARAAMIDRNIDASLLTRIIQEDLAGMGEDLAVEVAFQIDETGTVPVGRIQVDYTYPIVVPMLAPFEARFSVDSRVPMPTQIR